MGLFDLFRRRNEASEKQDVRASVAGRTFDIADINDTQDLAAFLKGGTSTRSGETIGQREAMAVSAVYRCTNLLCGVIGGLPIAIKDEETLVEDRKNPVRRLLNRRPNNWQTPHEFRKMLTYALIMRGNGYARKVYGVGQEVISLLPMHPDQTQPEQKPSGEIIYKHTDRRGRSTELSQNDVFHVRALSIDGVRGLGVLEHARESIGMARAAEQHGADMFRNGARISGALAHPKELTDEAYNRLRAEAEDFSGHGDRAGGTMILEDGLGYTPFGMTGQEAEFIENRKFSVQEICMFYGVPPHMVGFTEKTTSWGSGIEQQSIGFINYTLNDWFSAWEGAIMRDLLTNEDQIADFDTYPLLRGDEKTRWDANRIKLEMGAFNTDEIRRAEGKPAKPNGDGQQFYNPPNVPQKEIENEPVETPKV